MACALRVEKFGLFREATRLIKGKVDRTCSTKLLLRMLRSTVIHHYWITVVTETNSIGVGHCHVTIIKVRLVIVGAVHWLEVWLGAVGGGNGKTPRDERLALSGKATTHSGTLFQITIILINMLGKVRL